MKYCTSCGMPLEKKEDFAGGDESSNFCLYCVNKDGSVKSCEEVFEGGVQFFLEMLGNDRMVAERIVRKNMNQLPYWKDKNCEILKGEQSTDEEFNSILGKLED